MSESRAAILFHCALPDRTRFDTNPKGADSLTEQIDLNVIEACAESESIQCVVLVSSAAVYGQLHNSEDAFRETRLPDPVTQYGRTKLAQEQRMTAALGDRLAIARVFNVTGPAEPTSMVAGSLARRIAKAESQSVLPIYNSQSVRDFSDVRDVATALLQISRLTATAPRCFNVSSGVGTTILELAGLILTASGQKVKIAPDYLGAESRSVGDSQLLRSATGWRNKFGLQESATAVWISLSKSPAKK
jgi:nucleoside-diphosphate-sugar epimerase